MKYVKISNPGSFDIASAVNMIGASVKTNTDPIGMFGSGVKYALAQIVREGIKAKIWDGANLWNVTSAKKELRGAEFDMVQLKVTNGRKVDTPLVTTFGAHDWNDDWFIFREFVSNARDEKDCKVSIVDGADGIVGETAIFLPYDRFKSYFDNVDTLFTARKNNELWIDAGKVYRQNVYIGQLEGTTISFNCRNIRINECRVMDTSDAKYELAMALQSCTDVEIWKAFFMSEKEFADSIVLSVQSPIVLTAIDEALASVYGKNYCVVPNVNELVRDSLAMGYVPAILPSQMKVSDMVTVKHYLAMDNNKVTREMTEPESLQYNDIRYKCRAFIPMELEISVKVFSEGMEAIAGQANRTKKEILIRDTEFNNPTELMDTVIHEIGHIITDAGDYDRGFTSYFIKSLVAMANYANDMEAYCDMLEAK